MGKDIVIKHLILEILEKKKAIIFISVLIAALWLGLYYINAKNDIEKQQYGAYGEIYIKTPTDFEMKLYSDNYNENSDKLFEERIAMVTSNEVIIDVMHLLETSGYKTSKEELMGKIYISGKYNNSIICINVVTDEKKLSSTICEYVINCGMKYYRKIGYDTEIRQDTILLGPVYIDAQENRDEQGEKVYVINKIEENYFSILDVFKELIFGLLCGLLVCCGFVCCSFIFKGRIKYKEQIEVALDLNLLASIKNDDSYEELYTNMLMCITNELTSISFISYRCEEKVVRKFASFMKKNNHKVTVLEQNNLKDLKEINKQKTIRKEKEREELLFIECDDILTNPTSIINTKYTDGTIIIIEKGDSKIKEIQSIKDKLDYSKVCIIGAVFYEKKGD